MAEKCDLEMMLYFVMLRGLRMFVIGVMRLSSKSSGCQFDLQMSPG